MRTIFIVPRFALNARIRPFAVTVGSPIALPRGQQGRGGNGFRKECSQYSVFETREMKSEIMCAEILRPQVGSYDSTCRLAHRMTCLMPYAVKEPPLQRFVWISPQTFV
jgi:hypothetical protein